MLAPSIVALFLSATTLAAVVVPENYNKVYLQSLVDTSFVVQAKGVTTGSTVVVWVSHSHTVLLFINHNNKVNNKGDQHWLLTSNTSKIYLANVDPPTLCLDAGPKTAWKDMATVYVNTCSDTAPGQNWTVMADGRIGVTGSSPAECLDLQYMRATANNPVGLYQCAGLGNTGAKDKGINWPQKNVTVAP
ncbi:hypothetical protein GRF29_213g966212 [Pseudopithomyces chartarum]|uniref:Ricin B lectin domain-containing protein n=1 Tax=Pseudopithomyces chartarum TaxID=1892770 RepID=A0AAN6RD04_9PLEO|nr:hypothetical protein GRF29_213g966212 [Pseudopithomyces chartarum]